MSSIDSKKVRPVLGADNPILGAYSRKRRIFITFPEDSKFTKQEFKQECDINTLMSKYMSSGELPNLNQAAPQYADVTGLDYQEAMNFVAGAQSLFNELPSSIRHRFNHDPAGFLDFCSNPDNRTEMAEMGLLKDPSQWVKVPAAPVAPAANPVPSVVPPSTVVEPVTSG